MISVTVNYNGSCADIDFPCTEGELQKELNDLGITNVMDTIQLVSDVKSPIEFAFLKNQTVNLDELNFLAKRLDSFTAENELAQFYAIISHCKTQDLKDLINTTFNLHCYTLIRDMRNIEKIGEIHLFNIEGCMSKDEINQTDFTAIGLDLIKSGGIITQYGLLFHNKEFSFNNVYDGQVFPEYYYDECLFSATIEFKGKTETLYLPCSLIAINKAVKRLGADSLEQCSLQNLVQEDIPIQNWIEKLTDRDTFKTSDIIPLNRLSEKISPLKEFNKLLVVAEFAGCYDWESLTTLALYIDSFEYLPNVNDTEDLGHHIIDNSGDYTLSPDLEDFFNFDEFGVSIQEDTHGEFLSGNNGYVSIPSGKTLDRILGIDGPVMGGM